MKTRNWVEYKNRSGFTLIELIIVIVVIAILVILVAVGYNGVQNAAVDTSLKADLDNASGMIESFKQKNNNIYPEDTSSINGLSASGSNTFDYVSIGTAYCISVSSPRITQEYHYMSSIGKIEEGECGTLENEVAEFVTTLASGFNYPTGIASWSTEFVYVAETGRNRILKITAAGTVTVFAGSTAGNSGYTNDTGTAARFNAPHGIGVDSTGNVYVADQGNDVIRKITPAGVVSTLAGSGSPGAANGTGTAASFSDPYAVSIDPATNEIYVTEVGNERIRRITTTGTVTTVAGSTQGYANGTGSAAQFNDPLGMAFYGNTMYIAEYSNHTIRSVTKAGVVTTAYGANNTGYLDGTGTSARFNRPTGLAVRGNMLFIADSNNHRIRMANLTTQAVTTYAGTGTNGSSDDDAAQAQFSFPTGVAASPDGIVYVVETNAGRVRKIQ